MKSTNNKFSYILALILSVLIISSVFLFFQVKERDLTITKLNNQLSNLVAASDKSNEKLQDFASKYQSVYQEKNGTSNQKLLETTTKFFDLVYTYNSDDVKGLNSRKEEASNIVSTSVLNQFFQQNVKPSVKVSSKLVNAPEVYLESTNNSTIKALVLVNYEVLLDGSTNKTNTHYLYKVEYDSVNNKLIYVGNLGETSQL